MHDMQAEDNREAKVLLIPPEVPLRHMTISHVNRNHFILSATSIPAEDVTVFSHNFSERDDQPTLKWITSFSLPNTNDCYYFIDVQDSTSQDIYIIKKFYPEAQMFIYNFQTKLKPVYLDGVKYLWQWKIYGDVHYIGDEDRIKIFAGGTIMQTIEIPNMRLMSARPRFDIVNGSLYVNGLYDELLVFCKLKSF